MQLLLGIQFWKLHSMNRATVQISVDDANLHFGEIDFHQLNNGPLFGDDTKEILKEVFS